jgi:polyisoprenoid-binding protein YceI
MSTTESAQDNHLTTSSTGIPTGTWQVDKAHSRVGFAVKHLGVATVRGEFREFEGALEIGEGLAGARAYGRVDAASVDTGLAQRDEHLRSTDFFSAERHPDLTFRSKAIEPDDDDTLRVIGDLSINGVTNEVELIAEIGGIETDPWGAERIGLEVTGQVSRRAFGMKFDPVLGSGNALVGDKVKIVIDVEAFKEA